MACGSADIALLPLLAVVLALLLLTGCSSVQRDPPMQVWDDMKQPAEIQAAG